MSVHSVVLQRPTNTPSTVYGRSRTRGDWFLYPKPSNASHTTAAYNDSRIMGSVIFSGVLVATLFTLIVVPVFYAFLARGTRAPGWVAREIAEFERGERTPTGEGDAPSPSPAE